MEAYKAASGQSCNQFASANVAAELMVAAKQQHKQDMQQLSTAHANALMATTKSTDERMARMETMMENLTSRETESSNKRSKRKQAERRQEREEESSDEESSDDEPTPRKRSRYPARGNRGGGKRSSGRNKSTEFSSHDKIYNTTMEYDPDWSSGKKKAFNKARRDFCHNGTKEGTAERKRRLKVVLNRLKKEPRKNKEEIKEVKKKIEALI